MFYLTQKGDKNGYYCESNWFLEQSGVGSIDDGVTKAVRAIRVVQKVFPTVQLANATSVPADVFYPERISIEEGHILPFIEFAVEFP
jgi:hypothetical protein